MGLYDTIIFDRSFVCPLCKEKIDSIQVKEFENLLETYHVKDCVSHAEDIRIIKEELFCNHCIKHTGKNIYIVVNRGILLGIAENLDDAKELLNSLNIEKIVLWYYDQYNRYKKERLKRNYYKKFLSDLREWYAERYYEKSPSNLDALTFTENESHLKSTKDPIEAIESFLSYDKMKEVLDDLWEEGHETLDIYYAEDMQPGEEKWYVDVYQDDINERCKWNWTWTVINKKELESQEEKESDMPEWEILVDESFSEQVVTDAVQNWLKARGYDFDVKMIPIEEAKGSGLIKSLRERLEDNDFVKFDDIDKEIGQ